MSHALGSSWEATGKQLGSNWEAAGKQLGESFDSGHTSAVGPEMESGSTILRLHFLYFIASLLCNLRALVRRSEVRWGAQWRNPPLRGWTQTRRRRLWCRAPSSAARRHYAPDWGLQGRELLDCAGRRGVHAGGQRPLLQLFAGIRDFLAGVPCLTCFFALPAPPVIRCRRLLTLLRGAMVHESLSQGAFPDFKNLRKVLQNSTLCWAF